MARQSWVKYRRLVQRGPSRPTAFGLYLLAPDATRGLRQHPLRLYATRLRALLLAERLRGRSEPVVDESVQEMLAAHAPSS